MKNYFFTFGQQHRATNGIRMKDKWVRVTASSWDKAREIFINQFAKRTMKDGKWGDQYEEDKFKSYLYPDGEYIHLTEGKE